MIKLLLRVICFALGIYYMIHGHAPEWAWGLAILMPNGCNCERN